MPLNLAVVAALRRLTTLHRDRLPLYAGDASRRRPRVHQGWQPWPVDLPAY